MVVRSRAALTDSVSTRGVNEAPINATGAGSCGAGASSSQCHRSVIRLIPHAAFSVRARCLLGSQDKAPFATCIGTFGFQGPLQDRLGCCGPDLGLEAGASKAFWTMHVPELAVEARS